MKFEIDRVSRRRDEKPCPEAVRYADGLWTIEINSLEELTKFIEKNGKIIMGKDAATNASYIIIYDDYIE